jgi:hypothetical protein
VAPKLPEATANLDRLEADSKLFRSLSVLFLNCDSRCDCESRPDHYSRALENTRTSSFGVDNRRIRGFAFQFVAIL